MKRRIFSDEVLNRRSTDCVKWDGRLGRFGREDVLPLWVADSDIPVCPEIREALVERASHPFFGYTRAPQRLFEKMAAWIGKHQGWDLQPDWLTLTPGVVPALNFILLTFCEPGDRVIVQPPVYYPFFAAIRNQDCAIVNNRLLLENGRYKMDFEDLERKAAEGARAMLLCSPHNPVGRVWTREEISKAAEICLRHDVLLISDEIHADIILAGHKHIATASLSADVMRNTIACYSPSKTFSLPGLQLAGIAISDDEKRRVFRETIDRLGLGLQNPMSLAGAESAYTKGEPWLGEFLKYIEGNFQMVREFSASNRHGIRLIEPEGTYLGWLDFRSMGMSDKDLMEILVHKCGLGFDEGPHFGPGGEGFQRVNTACPRSMLKEALQRLERLGG